jgi:hypothetical protein
MRRSIKSAYSFGNTRKREAFCGTVQALRERVLTVNIRAPWWLFSRLLSLLPSNPCAFKSQATPHAINRAGRTLCLMGPIFRLDTLLNTSFPWDICPRG